MELAFSHRNQNRTGPHAVAAASPIRWWHGPHRWSEGARPVSGGLSPICKKLFGFIANMRQASYKSNAKTTCRTRRPALPHIVIPAKAGIQRGVSRGVSSPFAPPTPVVGELPESVRPEPVEACPEGTRRACPEGTRRGPPCHQQTPPHRLPHASPPCAAQHPDKPLLPPLRCLRYRLPMEVASLTATRTARVPMPSRPPS